MSKDNGHNFKKRSIERGRPSVVAVKLTQCFGGLGSPIQILRADLCTAYQTMLWQVFHTQNGGRWGLMLAQGQSSSAKRGGLAVDISSGLICLGNKKKRERRTPEHCALHSGRGLRGGSRETERMSRTFDWLKGQNWSPEPTEQWRKLLNPSYFGLPL